MREGASGTSVRRVACGGAVVTALALASSHGALAAVRVAAPAPLRARDLPTSLPAPVYRTVAVARAKRVYLLGGIDRAGSTLSSVDVFTPAARRAVIGGSLAFPTHGSAAANVRGRVLVFGGASSSVHDAVQYFDPATHRTTTVATLPAPRADTTAATSGATTVLVGGFNGFGPQAGVWATTSGLTFRLVAQLPQPVRYPASIADRGTVYVFGGLISGTEYHGLFSTDIQAVNLKRGTARVVGHLPTPVAHAMAASVGGHLYVMGGSTPAGPSAQVLEFIPTEGRVLPAGRLPQPLTDGGVASVGNTAYLLGGLSTNGPSARIVSLRPVR